MSTSQTGRCRECGLSVFKHGDGAWLHSYRAAGLNHPADPMIHSVKIVEPVVTSDSCSTDPFAAGFDIVHKPPTPGQVVAMILPPADNQTPQ